MIDRRHPNSYAAKHHPIGDSSEGLASYTQKKRTITRTQPRCLASPNLNGGIISLRSQEGLWRLCLTQPKGGHCGGLHYWTIISSPSLILMELRSFQVTARENVVRHRAACLDFYLELCVFFVFPVPLTSSPFSLFEPSPSPVETNLRPLRIVRQTTSIPCPPLQGPPGIIA